MFSINQFADRFAATKIEAIFFNEYKAITESIDRILSNPDLFNIEEENSFGITTTYRCEVSYSTSASSILVEYIVNQYKNAGWLVNYNSANGTLLFQCFVEVDPLAGTIKPNNTFA